MEGKLSNHQETTRKADLIRRAGVGQKIRSDTVMGRPEHRLHSPCLSSQRGKHSKGFKLKSIPVKSSANLVCNLFQPGWRCRKERPSEFVTWTCPWKQPCPTSLSVCVCWGGGRCGFTGKDLSPLPRAAQDPCVPSRPWLPGQRLLPPS